MPEYLSPGVYVEEVDTGPRPIEGVSTSTAGFVGVTQRGPVTGPPHLVTSFAEYRRVFGGYLEATWGDARYLPHAVQGFFENGGQRVYIKRVPGTSALASNLNVADGIITRLREDVPAGATTARLESHRGLSNGINLTFRETISGVVVSESRAVTTYNAATGQVTWAGGLGQAYSRAGASVQVRAPAGNTLTVSARDLGAWGSDLRVRFDPTTPAQSDLVANVVIAIEAIAAAPAFTVAGVGPAVGDTSIALNPGHGLLIGDLVAFERGATLETRVLTGVSLADVIDWADPIANDFTAASTIRMLTAIRAGSDQIRVPAALGALLQVIAFPNRDRVRISGGGVEEEVEITAIGGGNTQLTVTPVLANAYRAGDTLTLINVAVRAGGTSVRVRSARSFYPGALVELDNGAQREYFTVATITGNDLALSGATVNAFGLGNPVRLAEFKMSVRYLNEDERIDQLEVFDRLSLNPAATEFYLPNVVNPRSTLVTVQDLPGPAVPFPNPTTADGAWQNLQGGDDGTPPPDVAFQGADNGPGARTGIEALADIDQISLVAVPGKTSTVIQQSLIAHCELLKDRFAVLDPPAASSIQAVQTFRGQYDTRYAALYYPWLTINNPADSLPLSVPPSGHILGIYARTDVERGVHKAPANEVIRGILGFERDASGFERIVNKREQDILNPSPTNINVLRDFRADNRGLRVWGARCLTSDTPWKYVPVRRLFIFLEESIDEGTQWAVFEPNDEDLWATLRQSVSDFLTRVWRDGALLGATPEEAFFVRCDRTTMTQDDLDNGRLILLIGVAAVKPAEFVIIRIGQKASGAEIEEL
jgi:hypothetical protein